MAMVRIIDLSLPIENSPSEASPVEVIHELHSQSVDTMKSYFDCQETDLPNGLGWASDQVRMTAHSGTHVDAPWHYFPTSEGKKARTIDEIPLDWFYGNGVVLDMRHKPNGSPIVVNDLEQALGKINYKIKPRDIVLLQTGADKYWGKPEYFDTGCGMTRNSTLWLIEQGIRVMGIDAWGWDRPFCVMKQEFQQTHNKDILWEGHRAGINKEYCHIEKLANLDGIPEPTGFDVACFPVKLSGGSAGWCRAVAIIKEDKHLKK